MLLYSYFILIYSLSIKKTTHSPKLKEWVVSTILQLSGFCVSRSVARLDEGVEESCVTNDADHAVEARCRVDSDLTVTGKDTLPGLEGVRISDGG